MIVELCILECAVCHRGMILSPEQASMFAGGYFRTIDYCPEHQPKSLALTPENITKILGDAAKFLRDQNNPDGGENH